VRRAWKAATGAYICGYHDPVQREEMIARLAAERGGDVDVFCFFNDRRMQSRHDADAQPPTPADVRAALPLTIIEPAPQRDWYDGIFFLHVNESDRPLDFTMWVNRRHATPEEVLGYARAFESLLVDAVVGAEIGGARF
jgi:hypothetical protein